MLKFLRQILLRKKNRTRAKIATVRFILFKIFDRLFWWIVWVQTICTKIFVKKNLSKSWDNFYKYFLTNSRTSDFDLNWLNMISFDVITVCFSFSFSFLFLFKSILTNFTLDFSFSISNLSATKIISSSLFFDSFNFF